MAAAITHLVIIAGGQGTRLAALFPGLPKSLIPVAGKPVIQHQLEHAVACGVTNVTIFAGYLGDKIADYVGDGSRFGVKARVHIETEPLGNAGAVLRTLDQLPADFFVLYGDIIVAVDLRKLAERHISAHASFTVLVHPNDHPADSDLLDVDRNNRVTGITLYPHTPGRELTNLANAALYAIHRDALQGLRAAPGKVDFTKDVLPAFLSRGQPVLAYRSSEYIRDMGTPERLARVEADWRSGRVQAWLAGSGLPAVFLDRDGTLNVEKGYIHSPEQLELVPDCASSLVSLRHAGYLLVVLTNQSVIARGEASEADLAAIHRRLEWELGTGGAFLDAIYYCPHHPDKGFAGERTELKIVCDCRKPAIGLFRQACADLPIDAKRSWMIGNDNRDIGMAHAAGLRSILIAADGECRREGPVPDYVVGNLAAAAHIITQNTKSQAA